MPTGKRKAEPEVKVTTTKPAKAPMLFTVEWMDGQKRSYWFKGTQQTFVDGLRKGAILVYRDRGTNTTDRVGGKIMLITSNMREVSVNG